MPSPLCQRQSSRPTSPSLLGAPGCAERFVSPRKPQESSKAARSVGCRRWELVLGCGRQRGAQQEHPYPKWWSMGRSERRGDSWFCTKKHSYCGRERGWREEKEVISSSYLHSPSSCELGVEKGTSRVSTAQRALPGTEQPSGSWQRYMPWSSCIPTMLPIKSSSSRILLQS